MEEKRELCIVMQSGKLSGIMLLSGSGIGRLTASNLSPSFPTHEHWAQYSSYPLSTSRLDNERVITSRGQISPLTSLCPIQSVLPLFNRILNLLAFFTYFYTLVFNFYTFLCSNIYIYSFFYNVLDFYRGFIDYY